ncbi:MAG: transglycosylase domain-containing protein [Flavobacteriaceae bacterium]|nr:transglycosylase domain-containing protein [Flavobacteriaceae bacterium]MCY4266592.1 transglycosylase domain-containing protein [Flavobacteriaceae bacterium]MCY4297981.1 transglycosylase domain-containing protein [Flavobacteriaceae bacterium]
MKSILARMTRKIMKLLWILFFLGIVSVGILFGAAAVGIMGEMPDVSQLENPRTNLASQIISADGQVLGKFYYDDNRTPLDFQDLPTNLVNALIATEDERYYNHSGIDWKGTLRAVIFLGKKGGGSTITQQLARQLFVGTRDRHIARAVSQKIKEWIIAIRLERRYTKEEIIAMYLNIYDFGYQADGIESASRIFFNKKPHELLLEESAVLVGMLKNSSLYNPIRRPELTQSRRNIVLKQMNRNDFISKKKRDSLERLTIETDFTPQSHIEGLAPYFRSYVQNYVSQWINENPRSDGGYHNLYEDGLRIFTTIDSRLQKKAEDAVKQHMRSLQSHFWKDVQSNLRAPFSDIDGQLIDQIMESSVKRTERWRQMKNRGSSEKRIWESFHEPKPMSVFSWSGEIDTIMTPIDSILYYKHFLRASLLSMEPQTGNIKAWVGGINFKHFKFDQVKQGKRQVGSTFKPFLYATAIDQLKLSPCDQYPDSQYCIPALKYGNMERWCPKNSTNKYGETRTLSNGLANSVNSFSARIMDMVGPGPVIQLAQNLGIDSPIEEVPSIALGTPDISLYELVGAYSVFANYGIYIEPNVISRIEDKNGRLIYQADLNTRDVLGEESAYTVLNLLSGVTKFGTGTRLRHFFQENNESYKSLITGYPYQFENEIAGKTGTTQNQSDGWFMGMVPNLVTGVWVGGEDRSIHFKYLTQGQGATMALPIWALYMKDIYQDSLWVSKENFRVPKNLTVNLDCSGNIDLKEFGL